ncbi:hypothetical protein CYMTET_15628 [Cymbomonas tetramitiformis]|uniref:phosphoserine transaminase n=1 Tax=Cymbomonas tetramitiformis TaxID=36881 RepID=A0AAE0L8Y8_9CHLO|nr:hypothetical protein CYMTET_38108 [Cymbomonas tetramitiformis]KAK3276287.1 hypothetical protein CYMTET_15628 [Cymbomonas tetramitiformis]|eukprot:gene24379-29629_t
MATVGVRRRKRSRGDSLGLEAPTASVPPLYHGGTGDALAGSLRAANPLERVSNFSPGPTSLPSTVMRSISEEFLSWNQCGLSVLELSHRSPEFLEIKRDAEMTLREVMEIPEGFTIIWAHGGGHGQFAAIPLNLCGEKSARADYVVTGAWSERAAQEASKFCQVDRVQPKPGTDPSDWEFSSEPPAYTYICSNETIDGFEFRAEDFPHRLGVPLVVDMSSDICSKVLDWSRIGVAFACAPKNIGHPGLTVVIARNDLLERKSQRETCPGILDWKNFIESDGMWNTVATFNVYTTAKVLQFIQDEGGLPEMERRSIEKSSILYDVIESSGGLYSTPWKISRHRSRMNVCFEVKEEDPHSSRNTEAFLTGAHQLNIIGLKTKTPFPTGNKLRASLYTSVSISDVQKLASYMKDFQKISQ